MKTLTVKVPESLDERVDIFARRRNTTRSAVVREAIERFVKTEEAAESGSFLERAGDLAGVVAGPANLSTGARHLDGYGR